MRVLKFAAVTVGALIVLLVVLQFAGVTGRVIAPVLKARIEAATGYKLTKIDNVGLSLWQGLRVSAQDIALDKDDDPSGLNRVTIEQIEIALPFSSLWSGGTEVSDVVITHPVLYQPLLRRRLPDRPSRPGAATKQGTGGRVDRVRIIGGEVAFARERHHVDSRFGSINAVAMIDDRKLTVNGTALNAEHTITYEFKSEGARDQKEIPVEFVMQVPDLSAGSLKGRMDFSVSGSNMNFTKVEAKFGDAAFSGKAAVDLSNKPMVALELDLERLAVPVNPLAGDASAAQQAWSTEPFSSDWLNYVDADLRFSAAEVRLGTMDLAAHAVKARLENGVMKISLAEAKAQTPQAGSASGRRTGPDKARVNATITLDVNGEKQKLAIQSTFRDIPARPLLEAAAGFDRLEGRLQASIAVDSQGNNQQAVMSNLQGVVSLDFRDGAVRGINVAQMIRSLTSDGNSSTQSGGEKTDLSQLSASFSIDKGRASTSDIKLIGPMVRVTGAGTVDLGTRRMELRVEPTLVMTLEGQGRGSEPSGFGVPVTISGPWSDLQFHADIPGMLDNPQSLDTLEQLGSGLIGNFLGGGGANGGTGSGNQSSGRNGGSGNGSVNGLGGLFGDMIQQGISEGQGGGQRRPRQ